MGSRQVASLAYSGPQTLLGVASYRVIFDPKTSEILEWSLSADAAADHPISPARTETTLRTG